MSLPDGWIEQYDSNHKHTFWVDTRSNPPRAIWVHPYEDEQYLAAHPGVKAKEDTSTARDIDAPPSYDAATEGRAPASAEKEKSGSSKQPDPPDAVSAGPSSQTDHKRGVLGRLKDKAIGTKEEREEQKRIRAEQAAQAEERARKARLRELEERKERKKIRAEQAAQEEERARKQRMRDLEERNERRRIRAEQMAREEELARQARMRELEEREAYMRANGGYAPYHPSYGARPGYGPAPATGLGMGGGDNTAALLLGGLAGGLLLGDIFGGGGLF